MSSEKCKILQRTLKYQFGVRYADIFPKTGQKILGHFCKGVKMSRFCKKGLKCKIDKFSLKNVFKGENEDL